MLSWPRLNGASYIFIVQECEWCHLLIQVVARKHESDFLMCWAERWGNATIEKYWKVTMTSAWMLRVRDSWQSSVWVCTVSHDNVTLWPGREGWQTAEAHTGTTRFLQLSGCCFSFFRWDLSSSPVVLGAASEMKQLCLQVFAYMCLFYSKWQPYICKKVEWIKRSRLIE